MAKFGISVIAFFVCMGSFAQQGGPIVDTLADTAKTCPKDRHAWFFKDKNRNPRPYNNLVWTGFETGINGLMTPGFNSQPRGVYSFMELDYDRSWKFAWNVFEVKLPMNKKKTANLLTGAGFEWNNYSFKHKIALRELNTDLIDLVPGAALFVDASDTNLTYKRSRLQTSWFSIPLMVNFRTVRKTARTPQFNFTCGVLGSVRMDANQREVFLEGGNRTTNVRRDDFNLNRFRATAMVRMRFAHVSLFGSYTFTPMFRNGVQLMYPWSAGLAIHPF